MKKKVKKIPKYNGGGTISPDVLDTDKVGAGLEGGMNLLNMAFSEQDVNVGTALLGGMLGFSTGMLLGGPLGGVIGAGVGVLAGTAGRTNQVDTLSNSLDINQIKKEGSGWLRGFGMSDGEMDVLANQVQRSNMAKLQTENLKANYYSNPNVVQNPNVLAAEGGIMRRPVDALVSKGELIYDPETKKLTKVPGSKGKPNTDDDVYAKLKEGMIVIPNSYNSEKLTTNNKTLAYNLEPMVDKPNKKMSPGTIEARDRIVKKTARLNETIKTKPQEYAMFKDGWNGEIRTWDDYLKHSYNLSKNNKIDKLEGFWGYDSKKKKYNNRWKDVIDYIGSNKELREKAIKDLSGLSYVGTGEDAWDNIVKAAYDTKPADVHRYFRSVGDTLTTYNDPLKQPIVGLGRIISVPKGISLRNVKSSIGGMDHMTSYVPQTESEKLTKLTPEQIKQLGERDAALLKGSPELGSSENTSNWLDEMSNLLPIIGGLFDKYDYHTEQSQISPAKFVPVWADPRPLHRAADESYAMARYNLANISPNTGAGMAYGLQAAANRAKSYADAYAWQQDTQNKLIAQNAGIYNDWRRQRDAYATQAIADTRANEGAAQQMRDQARKDRLEFYYGKRNDDMLTAMMKPMFKYGTPDEAYRPIYKRRIV